MKLITFGRDITSLPEKNILLGYLIYMLGGFLLLMIPASRTGEIDWVDNLFTAVSAVSTTGLATIDIPASYTTGCAAVSDTDRRYRIYDNEFLHYISDNSSCRLYPTGDGQIYFASTGHAATGFSA